MYILVVIKPCITIPHCYNISQMKKHIAIVSTIGAGKTTAAKYFTQKGFTYYRLSIAIYNEIEKRGLDYKNRTLLQDVGDEMRRKEGLSILAKIAIKEFNKNPSKQYVIDSIRNHFEINELKNKFKNQLLIIAIDAPIKTRYKRITSRAEYNEKYSYKKFLKINKRDLGIGNKDNQQNNQKCLDMAEENIYNDKSMKKLFKKLDTIYKKHFNKNF